MAFYTKGTNMQEWSGRAIGVPKRAYSPIFGKGGYGTCIVQQGDNHFTRKVKKGCKLASKAQGATDTTKYRGKGRIHGCVAVFPPIPL